MSVSILEVIEAGGYDLSLYDDNVWLLAQVKQFEELVEKAQTMIDEEQERLDAIEEEEYRLRFGGEL